MSVVGAVATVGPTIRVAGRGGRTRGGGGTGLVGPGRRTLVFAAVTTAAPLDLQLKPLGRDARSLEDWLTTFHLAAVVLDPYTNESAWIIDTAGRILEHFRGADCRIAWIVCGDEDDARQFLGPWADKILTFADPERAFVKGVGLEHLPAFVHVNQDGSIAGLAEGWDPMAWREVAVALGKRMSWSHPLIPAAGDPVAYSGSPATA